NLSPGSIHNARSKDQGITPLQKWACFSAFFFTGFCALALEIVWTRLLVLIIGTSIYAFSIILMAYICGIPAGSILIPAILRRSPRMEAFGVVLMMLATASLLTIPLISVSPFIFLRIYSAYHGDFSTFLFVEYLLCLIVMLLPATLSGYAFTCALGSIRTSANTIGGDVGRLYFFNTIGSVLGSILAPFFFIKIFGLQNSIIVLSSIFLITGAALTVLTRARLPLKAIRIGACAVIFILVLLTGGTLDMDVIASGMHYHPEKIEKMKSVAELKRYIKLEKKIFLAEGVDSTVGIYNKNDVSSLKINGKVDASTGWYDMNTQLLLAHLPMILCKHPDRVSVIGLGAGVTAGAVMKYGPKQVDCIEINPNVIEAARYFKKISGLDFAAANLSIIEDDALSFMKNSRNKYNVIISEPSNPWMAGVASLFTVDHFQNCRARLEDGGIICQWLQIYSMSYDDFVRILVTFHKVFPNATLWFSSWGDALIIASKDDFDIDFNAVRSRVARDGIREQLGVIEVFSAEALLAHQILDSDTLSELSRKYAGTGVNSHERPYLEFSAPANYYRQDFEKITGALLDLQKPEKMLLYNYLKQFPPDDASYETLARAYFKLKQISRSRENFKKATDKNPALWFIHLKKAENLFAEGLLIEAINEVQIAIFLAPDKKECYAALLKVAIKMKDYYAIIRVFDAAEKYFTGPDRYEYHLAMATGYDGCGETQNAITHYRKVIELVGDNFIANKNLGLILLKSDDPKASFYLEKAYKLDQKDIEVIDALSKIHGGK
ncbi:MAG TPA: fused MFS/spermidine synthase, partial [Candidatus Wallbacteria bacterium]|nr:fused MFS/spermidine synthase [Candidatus Wallbacteria bacterium]